MALDFLVEEGLTDFQRSLQRALSNLPHRPSDIANVARLRSGLREVLALLNYGNVDTPVRGLEGALAQDIDARVVATRNGFDVIHLHLPRLRASVARPAVERVTRDQNHPKCMVVATSSDLFDKGAWHFINVKDGGQGRRVLRRAVVEPPSVGRTVLETLSQCFVQRTDEALNIQIAHEHAFDVEPVSRRFFAEYGLAFDRAMSLIKGVESVEQRKLFCQTLFNRLMFIAFIQKKGWLRLDSQQDYLSALWEAHQHDASPDKNFYRDRLELLFFAGLNTPNEVDVIGINRGGFLKTVIGDVPYLDGGLFAEDDRAIQAAVPDEAISPILNGLFRRFNFTVTESTPLDIEVAVDPEMLGRVFEELVTGRHETGSYYTPKPVVSFMCREALKGYLERLLAEESRTGIVEFVEGRDPHGLRNPEVVLDALRRVRVCDPACGSGAYLLGMLHELLDLRSCLFAAKNLDPISAYERKLGIIENNLYGVDVDPFAVNIARLRLWLSLAVDFEGARPLPLPNLDFKIESGDSLIAPNLEGLGQQAFRGELIQQYREAKADFMTAHGAAKLELAARIAALKQEILTWTHGGRPVNGFDWPVEFAEVFSDGGFDIVLANPPYVRADAQFRHLLDDEAVRQAAIVEWKAYRSALLNSGIYQTLYEKWDLYMPFLERAHELLRPGGRMVFIISDAYNAAKYARKSHEFFVKEARIERIDFCTDIPLFEAGVSNTIVHFAKATPDANHQPVRVRRWGQSPDDFERNAEVLRTTRQGDLGAAVFRADRAGMTLVEANMPLSSICYVSVGMVIHADERRAHLAFRTAELISETKDSKHPKPFVEGKNLIKWIPRSIRYLEYGTDRAPALFRRPTFHQLYEAPEKLISMDLAGDEPKVVYDNRKLFHNHSAWSFVPWHSIAGIRNQSIKKTAKYRDEVNRGGEAPATFREELEELSRRFDIKYVLAVTNSSFARDWLVARRRSRIHVYPDDWKGLPIALATPEQQATIASLVDQVLELYAQHGYPLPPGAQIRLRELEDEIDRRVEALYSL